MAAGDRQLLGELLIKANRITKEQLEGALDEQRRTGEKLGLLLVRRKIYNTAALLAVLSLASVAGAQDGRDAVARVGSGSARLKVTATVAARASFKIVHQRSELSITAADIEHGYVDVPLASRIEIVTNSRAGYLLVFEGTEEAFRTFGQVQVHGLGTEVQIGPRGGWVPRPYAGGPVTVDLSYRFILLKTARPGTYAWPLSITTRPL